MSDDKEQKKAERSATSNVFNKLPQKMMQEMKEAFTMIDQNRDGVIDMEDLKEIYSSFGKTPREGDLKEMLAEAPGPLNFTMFLSLFSENLSGTDPEDTLRKAFAMFDEQGEGKIPEPYLKDLLENMGDNFTKDEIRGTWKEAPISGGAFNYNEMVDIIKGKQQDDA